MSAADAMPWLANLGLWVLVALVLLGAVPLVAATCQFLLIGAHSWRNHYDDVGPYEPRVAILVPAWNEAAVLRASIDRLVGLDYPPDRLRVYVVDDASTDATPDVVQAKTLQYPGQVVHLRRATGGEGKAHTLNHGLRVILADDWMQALLIMDADVIYEPDSLRKMTRHLADPEVGAVTAYIKEGSRPGNYLQRFIAYEYVTAQAAARRSQNVLGALACLAGGAQLHSRANIEALGGRIDTTSLAEDTFTTFNTQLAGHQVVFDGNATVWAEEPDAIAGLWKQRLRWARGNVQVTRRYAHLWFRPDPTHRLGSTSFGIFWFSLFLLPVFMIVSSAALLTLYVVDVERSWDAFSSLWIINALTYLFITGFALAIDPSTARRSWREAILFPGVVSLVVILYTCAPRAFEWLVRGWGDLTGLTWTDQTTHIAMLVAYSWIALCMPVAWLGKKAEEVGLRRLSPVFVYLAGYGPLLCAVTVASYVAELRGADQSWDKTEKTGKVLVPR
jgi:cellulose synthase/poly-beta-1,6-N-acetylglucosamine synthase-like glycosyltransferase